MKTFSRQVYRGLLALYPYDFRQRFEAEMLETYELAVGDQGSVPLILDVGLSLGKHWVTRTTQGAKTSRPASDSVLGSVLTGEYPDDGAGLPSRARLLQGAVLFAVVAYLALNMEPRYKRLIHADSEGSVLHLPHNYELLTGGPPR